MIRQDTDILIVGAGLAGLQAALAITGTAPGLRIILADLGGCASTEIMGFCAPLAPGDSPEIFAADVLRAGGGGNDPALVRRLTQEAADFVPHLESLGLCFDRQPNGAYDLLQPVGSSFPRVIHQGTTTGRSIMRIYRDLLDRNPQVSFQHLRIIQLLTDNGQITGAVGVEQNKLVCCRASAVILAAGGAAGLFGISSWSKILRGSGYALAAAAGAQLTGMDSIQFEPCLTVWPAGLAGFPVITTLLFEGARLLDRNGHSLLDASRPAPRKSELARLIAAAITDGQDCGHGGVWFDFAGVDEAAFRQKYPEYYQRIRPFAVDFQQLRLEVRPAAHTTQGGVRIGANGATTVRGLFAAGEVTGGIHGRDRIGGNAGLEVLVFGRAAGESAAGYVKTARLPAADQMAELPTVAGTILPDGLEPGQSRAGDYLQPLGELLDQDCGVLVTHANLVHGLIGLRRLQDQLASDPPATLEDFFICRDALQVAEILLRARLAANGQDAADFLPAARAKPIRPAGQGR